MKSMYGQHCWYNDWQITKTGNSIKLKDVNIIGGYSYESKQERIKTESLRSRCIRILDSIIKENPHIISDYKYLCDMIHGADSDMLNNAILTRNKFGGQKRFISFLKKL